MRIKTSWLIWSALSIGGGAWLAYMLAGTGSTLFLPGETSAGHHQIEASCRTCHTRPFEGASALQNACVECHREELSEANDSHPKRLFTDPRNAAQIAIVDATQCVTCHREHKPDITGAMGVTIARDFCFACHGNIARERPSHEGFSPRAAPMLGVITTMTIAPCTRIS